MVPFVGICRVFIFSFFHIKRIITICVRRNYIFSQYIWSCTNSDLVELSFSMYVFLSFAISFSQLISETVIGSRAVTFLVKMVLRGIVLGLIEVPNGRCY